jgi:hypothetical protein
MSYYNLTTAEEVSALKPLPDVSNPAWENYYARGWREVIPFACPPGYVRKAGTRTLTVVGDAVTELWDLRTEAEADAEAIAQAEAIKAAQSELDNAERIVKGLALTMLDEINLCRGWLAQYKAAVAAAGTLAALKTSVAALPDMPTRTAAQLKAAVLAKARSL